MRMAARWFLQRRGLLFEPCWSQRDQNSALAPPGVGKWTIHFDIPSATCRNSRAKCRGPAYTDKRGRSNPDSWIVEVDNSTTRSNAACGVSNCKKSSCGVSRLRS